MRDSIIDLMLDDSKGSRSEIRELMYTDAYSRILFRKEKLNIKIENYINGEMSPSVKAAFEKRMKRYPHLMKEVKLRKGINTAVRQINLVEALNEVHKSYVRENQSSLSIVYKGIKTIKEFNKIAAAVLILIGSIAIWYFISTTEPLETRLYAEYYKPLTLDKSDRTFVLNSSPLSDAREKYQNKEYYDALVIFNSLPENINISAEKDFFIALSLMELQSFDKAIPKFQGVVKNKFQYLPHAYWYLGLCYLSTNQKEKAIETFNYIVEKSGYNASEAKKILKKLR